MVLAATGYASTAGKAWLGISIAGYSSAMFIGPAVAD
jgi:hypothetical protein